MNIYIRDYAQGDTAVSYDEGKKCLDLIQNCLQSNEEITLDFIDVNFIITAFLNPIIGDLILKYGPDIMSKIEINHASNDILNKIKLVKEGALLKREDIDE